MSKWRRITSYIQQQPAIVYANDTAFTLGKVDGKWVMEDFDSNVVETAPTLRQLKEIYNAWYAEE